MKFEGGRGKIGFLSTKPTRRGRENWRNGVTILLESDLSLHRRKVDAEARRAREGGCTCARTSPRWCKATETESMRDTLRPRSRCCRSKRCVRHATTLRGFLSAGALNETVFASVTIRDTMDPLRGHQKHVPFRSVHYRGLYPRRRVSTRVYACVSAERERERERENTWVCRSSVFFNLVQATSACTV